MIIIESYKLGLGECMISENTTYSTGEVSQLRDGGHRREEVGRGV